MPRRLPGILTKWYRAVLCSPASARKSLAKADLVYERAVEEGAQMYAVELLRDAAILLECSKEQYLDSHFLESRILAKLAKHKAEGAKALAEQSTFEMKKEIQKKAQSISEELRAIETFIRNFPRISPFDRVRREWNTKLQTALTDFSEVQFFLTINDFNSAQAHLGYTRALLQHMKRDVEYYKHNGVIGVPGK